MKPEKALENEKKYAIKIALDLKYSNDVIKKITNAKSINQITNILIDARRNSEKA